MNFRPNKVKAWFSEFRLPGLATKACSSFLASRRCKNGTTRDTREVLTCFSVCEGELHVQKPFHLKLTSGMLRGGILVCVLSPCPGSPRDRRGRGIGTDHVVFRWMPLVRRTHGVTPVSCPMLCPPDFVTSSCRDQGPSSVQTPVPVLDPQNPRSCRHLRFAPSVFRSSLLLSGKGDGQKQRRPPAIFTRRTASSVRGGLPCYGASGPLEEIEGDEVHISGASFATGPQVWKKRIYVHSTAEKRKFSSLPNSNLRLKNSTF